jgi:hypothetical protein
MFKILIFSLAIVLLGVTPLSAQDTIYVYDINSGNESYILLPSYNTAITADSLPPEMGVYGMTPMPASTPTDTIDFFKVSRPFAVSDSFTSFNYPFTAITQASYSFKIAPAVIGKHALLVFNYDVYTTQWKSWRNPYPIKPFYNNGTIQFGHQQLTPIRYYALSPLSFWLNFAIIEVAEDIGSASGHFGLAFDTARTSFKGERMLYNISYPAENNINVSFLYNDSVNGDTMYMRYGNPGLYGPGAIQMGKGGDGEYASPLFDEYFQIRGIRWDFNRFEPVAPKSFYFAKYVLENLATDLRDVVQESEEPLSVFPNPCNGSFYVRSKQPVEVYDISGRLVCTYNKNIGSELRTIDNPGIYFVKQTGNTKAIKLVVIE